MGDESPEQPEGGGPVHYQISITGKQAGVFFLLLLLALGLAFFFGMKTGAAARKGEDAVSQIAGVSDLPVPTIAPGEKGDKGEKPAPTVVPEPAEKKLGFEDAGPSTGTAAAPTPTPTAAPAAAAPTPAKPTPAKPTPSAEKPEKAAAKSTFHVQVFATKDSKKADDWVKKLKKEGFKADVSPSPKSPELFVVRVGPLADKAKAEAQKKKILKANPGLKGMLVIPS